MTHDKAHLPLDDEERPESVRSAWLASRRSSSSSSLSNSSNSNNSNNANTDDYTDNDKRFRRCWGRNSCSSCLGISACSWCPFSATCVPNDYLVPALAPAWEGDYVCPYWAERWELRTRPLGCQVSTITSLTALVAGSSTLVVALLLWLLIVVVRWLRRVEWSSVPAWRTLLRRPDGPVSSDEPVSVQTNNEQTPLLSDVR